MGYDHLISMVQDASRSVIFNDRVKFLLNCIFQR